MLAFSLPVLAFDEPDMGKTLVLKMEQVSPSEPEIVKMIESGDFDTMKIKTDTGKQSGNFEALEWITKSTYAQPTTQTKYQTVALWFKIGEHWGWVDGKDFRTKAEPNKPIYERATIKKEAFINSFMSNSKMTREEAEAIINTEEYLYTGAWIIVFNDYNLNGQWDLGEEKAGTSSFMYAEDINKMANLYFGGSSAVVSDWQSRFQKIKLNEKVAPDFFSTPEGETEWQEHFLTSAKTYTGQVGERLIILGVLSFDTDQDIKKNRGNNIDTILDAYRQRFLIEKLKLKTSFNIKAEEQIKLKLTFLQYIIDECVWKGSDNHKYRAYYHELKVGLALEAEAITSYSIS